MHFPLPSGICRKVCRPARSTPRLIGQADVVRLARAAVRHGADPCALSRAVRRAMGCCCDDVLRSIDDGVQAIMEDIDRIQEILDGMAELAGILIPPLRGKSRPGDVFQPVTQARGWRLILQKLGNLIRPSVILAALVELAIAIKQLIDDILVLLEDISRLMTCCSCEEPSNDGNQDGGAK